MDPCSSPLLTDLYQLTMLHGYFEQGMEETAVFELFVRRLPPRRGFLLAAGLEQALDFLEGLRFGPEEIEWMRGSGLFRDRFLDFLRDLRFTGDVHALPEGTAFFPDEPIIRVTAPLPEAQVVESRLINLIHYETLIASKAARCVLAAPGRQLVDFGMRRAHGAEAALLAARASTIAGFAGTATVLAGARFGIPVFGTMAHSFIQAHDSEEEAFLGFATAQAGNLVFLIDTYDTERAARKVVEVAERLAERGIRVNAVRLDSGDLERHARRVREILDRGGFEDVRIFASGSLDEDSLKEMVALGAPIDGFGVGTRLDVSADAPYLDCAYKLEEYAGVPRRKHSEGKATWPGRKQVYRRLDANGRMAGDLLALEGEKSDGEQLLRPVMRAGKRLGPPETLAAARSRAARELERLPEHLRMLETSPPYPVIVSDAVQDLAASVDRRLARAEENVHQTVEDPS